MKCPFCKKEIDNKTNLCNFCGKKIEKTEKNKSVLSKIVNFFFVLSKLWAFMFIAIMIINPTLTWIYNMGENNAFINFSAQDWCSFFLVTLGPYLIIKLIKMGMENKKLVGQIKKYQIILLVVLVAGFAFYWYEYRPSQARKQCSTKSYSEDYYKKCLRERGIEK